MPEVGGSTNLPSPITPPPSLQTFIKKPGAAETGAPTPLTQSHPTANAGHVNTTAQNVLNPPPSLFTPTTVLSQTVLKLSGSVLPLYPKVAVSVPALKPPPVVVRPRAETFSGTPSEPMVQERGRSASVGGQPKSDRMSFGERVKSFFRPRSKSEPNLSQSASTPSRSETKPRALSTPSRSETKPRALSHPTRPASTPPMSPADFKRHVEPFDDLYSSDPAETGRTLADIVSKQEAATEAPAEVLSPEAVKLADSEKQITALKNLSKEIIATEETHIAGLEGLVGGNPHPLSQVAALAVNAGDKAAIEHYASKVKVHCDAAREMYESFTELAKSLDIPKGSSQEAMDKAAQEGAKKFEATYAKYQQYVDSAAHLVRVQPYVSAALMRIQSDASKRLELANIDQGLTQNGTTSKFGKEPEVSVSVVTPVGARVILPIQRPLRHGLLTAEIAKYIGRYASGNPSMEELKTKANAVTSRVTSVNVELNSSVNAGYTDPAVVNSLKEKLAPESLGVLLPKMRPNLAELRGSKLKAAQASKDQAISEAKKLLTDGMAYVKYRKDAPWDSAIDLNELTTTLTYLANAIRLAGGSAGK